jgi:hypothetical protein
VGKDLSIGSQLFRHGSKFYFMAHRKIDHKGKKVYLGKIVSFDPHRMEIKVGEEWLSHSLNSLFGSDISMNKRLHSCTYFSSMYVEWTGVTLLYGINDVGYGASIIGKNNLP